MKDSYEGFKTKDLPEVDSRVVFNPSFAQLARVSTGFNHNAVRRQTAPCPAGSADSMQDAHSEAGSAITHCPIQPFEHTVH